MYPSYVLYKGFLAVYPFVWLYKLAIFLGVNEWLFIKLFYAVAFAYITAVGLPNLIELLTKVTVVHYRKLILAILCFYLWKDTYALSEFMVDIPALMYFLLLVNSALRIYRYGIKIQWMLLTGVWLGLNLGGSGQYTSPALCVCIFLVIVIFKQYYKEEHKHWASILMNIGVLVIPMTAIKKYNDYFLNVIVGGLREAGAWLPTNSDWLEMGFSRLMNIYRTGGGVIIPSNLNQAIFQAELGSDVYAEMRDYILAGGYRLTVTEYLKLVLKHPVDFALCYLEKFFLVLSPDGGAFRFLPLFIFYTLLFITLYLLVTRCKKFEQIFNVRFWIVFAFLWAIVPALVMVTELRFAMQIQGLVMAVAICDDFIWKKAKELCCNIKHIDWKFKNKKIPYIFLLYCVFIVVCFLHMSSLYEGVGVDANSIMMRFW